MSNLHCDRNVLVEAFEHRPCLELLEAKIHHIDLFSNMNKTTDRNLPENCLVPVVDNQLFRRQRNHANQFESMQLETNN